MIVNRGDVDLLMWCMVVVHFSDPIKPKVVGVVCSQQLTCYLLIIYSSLLAMSLINNHTFEHSMGH